MSTLYGDSIFESNDMIIDRLFESINNDMLMFESADVIVEAGKIKEFINNAIENIKEIIRKIKDKFNEIIAKISGNIIYAKTISKIKNGKLPITYRPIEISKLTEFEDDILDYNDQIIPFINTFGKGSKEFLEKQYIEKINSKWYNSSNYINFALFYTIVPIKTEDERSKFLENFNKHEKDLKSVFINLSKHIKTITSSINNTEKSIDKLSKHIKSLSKDNETYSSTIDEEKVLINALIQYTKYLKDYIYIVTDLLKNSVITHKTKYKI